MIPSAIDHSWREARREAQRRRNRWRALRRLLLALAAILALGGAVWASVGLAFGA